MSANEVAVRVASAEDLDAIAGLRALWTEEPVEDPGFVSRMADWIALEAERRTTWVASVSELPVGMASMFEYRRMPRPGRPDSRWGYVSNMFVRPEFRNRGIGSTLLTCVVTAAERRGYARLVLSPSARALPFYQRAGFIVPDNSAGDDRLLVRRIRLGSPQPPNGDRLFRPRFARRSDCSQDLWH
jgi:GNAT superfamily N-acetyltransferase